MSESNRIAVPEITDDDIRWVSGLLSLPSHAFHGVDGKDPRQHVLKSMESIDVAACPGSGKTTLLVAKLAILAEKWESRTQGVCIISHTNVARHEIEARVGYITAGRRLLSYPHFIGTIHGFMDEYLAIPWLRSGGFPIKLINTEMCQAIRWTKIPTNIRWGLQNKNIDQSDIRMLDSSFEWGRRNGSNPYASHTETYKRVKDACVDTAKEGYHCYDDMFIWARDMLDKLPGFAHVIRSRFPILFVDETQDNSEEQSSLLHRIFMTENNAVVRQRFGDENQAIFDSVGPGTDVAVTDKFPESDIRREIFNSYRFGQHLADLADPLGINRYGLKGNGPKSSLESGSTEGPHTIFLFGEDFEEVFKAYGQLLTETFSEQELRDGTFMAVGQVHRDNGDDHAPRHVGHYWPEYNPEMVRSEPRPKTFVQYLLTGVAKAESTGETYPAVERIAEGILRLARIVNPEAAPRHPRYLHRYVLQLIEGAPAKDSYKTLIDYFVIKKAAFTTEEWNSKWRSIVSEIGETIGGTPVTGPESSQFLEWSETPIVSASQDPIRKGLDNTYRFSFNGKNVDIEVGSIHSVKGETHTATLVLETFWRDNQGRHNLELLLPWLKDDIPKGGTRGIQQQTRLRIHYVAMTRPSHLLCLAMMRSSFLNKEGNLDHGLLHELEQRGWRCVDLG